MGFKTHLLMQMNEKFRANQSGYPVAETFSHRCHGDRKIETEGLVAPSVSVISRQLSFPFMSGVAGCFTACGRCSESMMVITRPRMLFSVVLYGAMRSV